MPEICQYIKVLLAIMGRKLLVQLKVCMSVSVNMMWANHMHPL